MTGGVAEKTEMSARARPGRDPDRRAFSPSRMQKGSGSADRPSGPQSRTRNVNDDNQPTGIQMLTRHSFGMLLIAAALVQTATATASAQSVNHDPGHRVDVERAVRLETEARALFNKPTEYDKAARMLRKAARLRPDEDRQALQLLGSAGVVAYHAGDFRISRATLVEQAERALSVGEVGVAAHALIDAAFAAEKLNDVAAFDYIARARLLATSTLIAPEERTAIAKRIGGEPTNNVVESAASGL